MITRWRCHVVNGIGFALCVWLIVTIAGEPTFMHGRTVESLLWSGTCYALGSSAGWNDLVRLARRQRVNQR